MILTPKRKLKTGTYIDKTGTDSIIAHVEYVVETSYTGGIDDTPVDGVTTKPISSNWAADHLTNSDPHTGYRLESADHTHQSTGAQAGQLDHGLALTGLTDDDHTQYQKESLLTTAGDIPYATAASTWARLAIGSNALLGISGGVPAWVTTIPAVTASGKISMVAQYLSFGAHAPPDNYEKVFLNGDATFIDLERLVDSTLTYDVGFRVGEIRMMPPTNTPTYSSITTDEVNDIHLNFAAQGTGGALVTVAFLRGGNGTTQPWWEFQKEVRLVTNSWLNVASQYIIFGAQTRLVEKETDWLQARNSGDTGYGNFATGYLRVATALQTPATDSVSIPFNAQDNGVGLVEIARLQGAADPYFQATLAMRLNPIATASLPATPVEGMLVYDDTANALKFYNGAAWVQVAVV